MNYLIVSMYTVGTPYEEEIKNLEKSLKELNLEFKFYSIKSQGSWEKNCQEKAKVILQSLNEQNLPVVWIDADAVVNENPVFFENLDCDISAYYMKTKYNPNELLSGTVYYGNTDRTKKIVQRWIHFNRRNNLWDQKNLQKVLELEEHKLTPLPVEYIKINNYEKHQGKTGTPVITHYQASRKYKKGIK